MVGVELGVGRSLPSLSLLGTVRVSKLEGGVLRRRLSAEPRALPDKLPMDQYKIRDTTFPDVGALDEPLWSLWHDVLLLLLLQLLGGSRRRGGSDDGGAPPRCGAAAHVGLGVGEVIDVGAVRRRGRHGHCRREEKVVLNNESLKQQVQNKTDDDGIKGDKRAVHHI